MRPFSWLPLFVCTALLLSAQPAKLTLAEQEEFLKNAKVIKTQASPNGITGTIRATLSDSKITHDAQIQSIDEAKTRFEGTRGVEMNFRDSYKYNIAGYRLARLLGLNMVPPSVERSYAGHSAAFTWWVDDVMMEEAGRVKKKIEAPDSVNWNHQMFLVRVFDQLIYNTDRNLGNLLITKDWNIWMIDHTRAFRTRHELLNVSNLVKCDRGLLTAMKGLDAASLHSALGNSITNAEIQGLLKRRDKIVSHFEKAGEGALYSLPPRPTN